MTQCINDLLQLAQSSARERICLWHISYGTDILGCVASWYPCQSAEYKHCESCIESVIAVAIIYTYFNMTIPHLFGFNGWIALEHRCWWSCLYHVLTCVCDASVVDWKLSDIFFNCQLSLSETYHELNKALLWFIILLSFTGLYMYKILMTTEAGEFMLLLYTDLMIIFH